MCGDALLVAPIAAAGRRGRDRAAAGRAGTTSTRASASPAGACCATARRSTSSRCSGAKATRCRSVAPSSTPARSIAARPLEQLWVFGKPARAARRASRRLRIDAGADGAFAVARAAGVQVEVFGDAAGVAVGRLPDRRRAAMHDHPSSRSPSASPPASAPSSSRCSPSGTRARRSRPGSSCVGDRAAARARAPRAIGLVAALRRLRSRRVVRAARRRRRDLAPAGRRAGHARPSRSDQRAAACWRCCSTRRRRLRDRRVRRAGHRAGAEERAAWTPASRSPGTPSSSPQRTARRAW